MEIEGLGHDPRHSAMATVGLERTLNRLPAGKWLRQSAREHPDGSRPVRTQRRLRAVREIVAGAQETNAVFLQPSGRVALYARAEEGRLNIPFAAIARTCRGGVWITNRRDASLPPGPSRSEIFLAVRLGISQLQVVDGDRVHFVDFGRTMDVSGLQSQWDARYASHFPAGAPVTAERYAEFLREVAGDCSMSYRVLADTQNRE